MYFWKLHKESIIHSNTHASIYVAKIENSKKRKAHASEHLNPQLYFKAIKTCMLFKFTKVHDLEVWLFRKLQYTVRWHFQRTKEDIKLLYQNQVYRKLNILLREENLLKKKKEKERGVLIGYVIYKYLFCNGRFTETNFGCKIFFKFANVTFQCQHTEFKIPIVQSILIYFQKEGARAYVIIHNFWPDVKADIMVHQYYFVGMKTKLIDNRRQKT